MDAPLFTPDSKVQHRSGRGGLISFLMTLSGELGADGYMLVAKQYEQGRKQARVLASNWMHDAVELAGTELITRVATMAGAAAPGFEAAALVTSHAPAQSGLTGEEARLLAVLGHVEIFALRLWVGRRRYVLLLSSEEVGAIDSARLPTAQMRCCYALSAMQDYLTAAVVASPLSDRERECLAWVSEGKTTEELAQIVGVSANTAGSYIAQAMRKLSAGNRAMATATAIRSGLF